jgi:hypothetical protein
LVVVVNTRKLATLERCGGRKLAQEEAGGGLVSHVCAQERQSEEKVVDRDVRRHVSVMAVSLFSPAFSTKRNGAGEP